jgi:hypothetical protein
MGFFDDQILLDAEVIICFMGINQTKNHSPKSKYMKKKSRIIKAAHYSKFILLVMLMVLISNKTIAQCTDNTTCQCEQTAYNIEAACAASCSGYQSHLTQLDCETYGLCNVASVKISATGFSFAPTVEVTHIKLYTMPGCVQDLGGGGAEGYSLEEFNSAGYNITFSAAGPIVTISTPGDAAHPILLPNNYIINFIVNVKDGNTKVTSRNYFFKITSTSYIVGDTHITTVDGVKYDFQAVGEFVALLDDDGDNLEIQTRQAAVATNGPGFDSYDNLSTCVTVNTAVAARVGSHRVTYQPKNNGIPDSSNMELRVDGNLTELGDKGLDLGSGSRVIKSPAGGGVIEIDFPDGASLVVTPAWWSSYNVWYLNVNVYNTSATRGIMGVLAVNKTNPGTETSHISAKTKSWLPALPDGSSVGPMPQNMHDRFVTLYKKFADAWRVTDKTSLFDYAQGTSTATFTDKNWPVENGQTCSVVGQTPMPPISHADAEKMTIGITDPILKANAIYDVMITGEPTFAKTYLLTQKIQTGTTVIKVFSSKDMTNYGEPITFTASVSRKYSVGKNVLTGSVEFSADGKVLDLVKLDANGHAVLTTKSLKTGQHQISAKYIVNESDTTALSSSSLIVIQTVTKGSIITQLFQHWWSWVLLIALLIILYLIFRKRKP